MFAYPICEGGGSFDFKLCLPIDSMNAFGNDQEFKASLLQKKNQFWFKNDQFRPKVINYNQL